MSDIDAVLGYGAILFSLCLAIYMYKFYYEKEKKE